MQHIYTNTNFIFTVVMIKKMSRIKGFTLVEVTITLVIMGVLIGLIFEIFITIGRISVFVQLNRLVHSEFIYVIQTIQNMVDDQNMQLVGFDLTGTGGDLQTFGRQQRLRFSDTAFNYEITNNCTSEQNCYLELDRIELDPNYSQPEFIQSGSVALTDPNFINVTSFYVRTVPYGPPTEYEHILHKGFWLFVDFRVPQYDTTKWWYKVNQELQLFFTTRKYE